MVPVLINRGIVAELLFTLDAQGMEGMEAIPSHHLPLPAARKGKSLPRYPAALLRLTAFLKERRPDVVHLNELDEIIFFVLAARMAGGIPVVATARSFLKSSRRFRKLWAHRLSRLVCVSEAGRRQATEGGVAPDRILVVHDPPDVRWGEWPAEDARTRWRETLRVPASVPVIGTVGNLSPVKGTDVLIEALPFVVSRFPEVRCVFVGADDRRWVTELTSRAETLGVARNIVFTGSLPDPRPVVSLMDVFVLPSRLEGYGLALLEAMSYERPVVASRIGGIMDIIGNDEVGVLVPVEHPGELGKAVADLLADPVRRKRLAAAGARRAREDFGVAGVMKLCEMYRELAGGKA